MTGKAVGLGMLVVALGIGPSACGSDPSASGDGDFDDDGTGGNGVDAGSNGGGGDTPDASVPPDAGPPEVRFVVMGDTGEGNDRQYRVADVIEDKCAADGCDFVILLGDNIYDDGVTDVDDPQWTTKFEDPYADIDLPFYAVLGNHDYGGTISGGMGDEWEKGPVQVRYTDHSDKWIMPDTHYTVTWEHTGLIMLDTNSILWGNTEHGDQRAWYPTAMSEVADSDWIFAAGHHPYLSNGTHGNAGNYESIEVGGVEIPNPLPILNGGNMKTFMEEVVCGTVDIYFAAHDHDREWLDENDAFCGTELIISGAGAKMRDLGDNGNAAHWGDDQYAGFLWVEIVGNRLTGQFINENGEMEFERTIDK